MSLSCCVQEEGSHCDTLSPRLGQDNTDQTPQGTRRLRAVFTRSLEYQRSRAGHHPKAHLMRVNEVCTEALVTRQLRIPSLPECQGPLGCTQYVQCANAPRPGNGLERSGHWMHSVPNAPRPQYPAPLVEVTCATFANAPVPAGTWLNGRGKYLHCSTCSFSPVTVSNTLC